MIYLASPYSHPDPSIMHARYEQALAVTAILLARREYVYSPIVHCHELAQRHELPTDFEFWKGYNRHMLLLAAEVRVLALGNSWRESTGVTAELVLAKANGIRRSLIDLGPRNEIIKLAEL